MDLFDFASPYISDLQRLAATLTPFQFLAGLAAIAGVSFWFTRSREALAVTITAALYAVPFAFF